MRYIMAFWILCLGLAATLGGRVLAQSAAQGQVVSYNEQTRMAVLDLDESDLRFNQIETGGGLISLTIGGTTRQAYLIPAERVGDDLRVSLAILGLDGERDSVEAALILGRTNSLLASLVPAQTPLALFQAQVGDNARLEYIAPLPASSPMQFRTTVAAIQDDGDLTLALSPQQAEQAGLFQGMTGTVTLITQQRSFAVVTAETYFTSARADLYLMPDETGQAMQLLPSPETRPSIQVAQTFGIAPTYELSFDYSQFDAALGSLGRVTEIQGAGQILLTDIPASYLEEANLTLGSYAVVILNGVLRGAVVLDEVGFAEALQQGGLSANYVLLAQSGILKIVYVLADGRTAQAIFGAELDSKVWIRPAQAQERIVRAEAVVKAISEIDAAGVLYTDISPLELSYLSVLVGQYVNVQINSIQYRAQVVDEALLQGYQQAPSATPEGFPEGAILLYPSPVQERLLITQAASDTISAEARFQASVGDAVILSPAPN
jgi:hypothetical protein